MCSKMCLKKGVPGRHITTQSGTKTAFQLQPIMRSNLRATKMKSRTFEDKIASISRERSFRNPHTQAATANGHNKNSGMNVKSHLYE